MRRTASLVLASALFTVGACDTFVDNRGFSPTPGSVEKLEVGSQSREDVVRLIGSPTAVSTFDPNVWYYINQRQDQFAFFKPTLTAQNIMQVTFADTGRVKDLKYYDLGVEYAFHVSKNATSFTCAAASETRAFCRSSRSCRPSSRTFGSPTQTTRAPSDVAIRMSFSTRRS